MPRLGVVPQQHQGHACHVPDVFQAFPAERHIQRFNNGQQGVGDGSQVRSLQEHQISSGLARRCDFKSRFPLIVVGNGFEIARVGAFVTLFDLARYRKPELGNLLFHAIPPTRGAKHDIGFRVAHELLKRRSAISAKIFVYRHGSPEL